jgi:hypothetical protein
MDRIAARAKADGAGTLTAKERRDLEELLEEYESRRVDLARAVVSGRGRNSRAKNAG